MRQFSVRLPADGSKDFLLPLICPGGNRDRYNDRIVDLLCRGAGVQPAPPVTAATAQTTDLEAFRRIIREELRLAGVTVQANLRPPGSERFDSSTVDEA